MNDSDSDDEYARYRIGNPLQQKAAKPGMSAHKFDASTPAYFLVTSVYV